MTLDLIVESSVTSYVGVEDQTRFFRKHVESVAQRYCMPDISGGEIPTLL
jgi:hypothetical protein